MVFRKVFCEKKLIISILLLYGFVSVFGINTENSIILSDKAEITLLTSTPGEELYSVFGHSALRVNDPENEIDLVYNYGTFDFDTPNFYYKFAKGRLMYMLSVGPYRYYESVYRIEGRAIYEQVLNLYSFEKQKVFEFLRENALPENKYYHYDFFYDNCATRIRDIVDEKLNVEWYEEPYDPDRRTFRDLLSPYLENMPWSEFGIDIALGLPADKVAEPYEYMFIPDEMFIAFANAQMVDERPLVSEDRILLEKRSQPAPPHPISPNIAFWLIFALGLISFANKKAAKLFDIIFFSALSITGLLIIFLWFISEHLATNSNMNLLWALPFHIYFFLKYHFSTLNSFSKWYFKVIMVLSALMIFFWELIPQGYNAAFFPIVFLIFIKSIPPALDINITDMLHSLFRKKKKTL